MMWDTIFDKMVDEELERMEREGEVLEDSIFFEKEEEK